MDQTTNFSYRYSAKENNEIMEIRKKYLPESKMDELMRLDRSVRFSGIAESLCLGVMGFLMFGLGICFCFQLIGDGMLWVFVGSLFSIVGMVGIILAYPIYRLIFRSTKERYTPRILELVSHISGE